MKKSIFKTLAKFNKKFLPSYSKKELENLINEAKKNNTILITTEKDYFRIDENYKKNINYLKIAVDIKNRNQLIEEIKKII